MKANLATEQPSLTTHQQSSPATCRRDARPQSWPIPYAVVLGLLGLLLGLSGCQPLGEPAAGVAGSSDQAPYTSTRLGEGDAVRVAFEGETNMNTVVKVQLDGTISLPLIGSVKAVGMTPEQLRTDLMARYKNLLGVNEITVVVSPSASVYVSGAVLRPGRIAMERPLTALEAIMEAGGFGRNAKPASVSVIRTVNGQQQHFTLNLKSALSGQEANPFYLKPYDIVHVPEKAFNF